MPIAENLAVALWRILLELAPSLLLGLLIAGLIHAYLPTGFVHRGLSRANLRSVLRASLIGVPLPLCSCGVIPTALGLRQEGASKGATTAFMISTPQTGVDSILVSAAFLGWPFALFKVVAAFATGLIGGAVVNRFDRSDPNDALRAPTPVSDGPRERSLIAALRYAVFDLLGAIDLWIIAGALLAAAVTVLLPADYFASHAWSQGVLGMLVVLAISLPLYVCTTGSVPIAASLIATGLPTGSALVFLMAGPATNLATFGAVYRTLGGRILSIYLAVIIGMSVLFGLLFDALLAFPQQLDAHAAHAPQAGWLNISAALTLIAFMALLSARRLRRRFSPAAPVADTDLTLKIEGMTCNHCVATVKQALERHQEVEEASPDLGSGLVRIRGDRLDASALIETIRQAGFQAGADA